MDDTSEYIPRYYFIGIFICLDSERNPELCVSFAMTYGFFYYP